MTAPRLRRLRRRLVLDHDGHRYPVSTDKRGRRRVYLGRNHPLANRSGGQWLARYLLAVKLGYRPATEVHAHHRDGVRDSDTIDNIDPLPAPEHMRRKAQEQRRASDGRFSC